MTLRLDVGLLARLARLVTINAREAYEPSADSLEYLRRYNEIQHVLTSQLRAALAPSGAPAQHSSQPSRKLLETMRLAREYVHVSSGR